ncbi:MAG: hypothetical protein JRH11_12795 [Deltaproteobacteria bacterium]|nr:hypothetical protein [Deltaproteobacteria bacterium]
MRITEAGDQLVIHGTPERRTNRCWSYNRNVRPVSSSHRDGTWRVVCRIRPDDPRGETGTYSLTASDDNRLSYREVSNYDWQLNESHCRARMTVTQVFTRAGTRTTPTKATPEQQPEQSRCTPGSPAGIRLRPRDAQVEPAGAVRFTARVVDGSGCPVPGRRVQWQLAAPSGATGQLDGGLFTAAENAAEAEGEFTVTASGGGSSARATVTVRTADLSDLIARRATVGVTQTVDEDFELTAESSAVVSARGDEGDEEESSILPLVIAAVLVLALLFAVAVVIVAQRGGRKASTPEDEDATSEPPVTGESDPGFEALEPAAGAQSGTPGGSAPPPAESAGEALICPTCRRGFGPETKICPSDGVELIPYAAFVEQHRASETSSGGKICPTCGERFGRNTVFCGKDGAVLEEIN